MYENCKVDYFGFKFAATYSQKLRQKNINLEWAQ